LFKTKCYSTQTNIITKRLNMPYTCTVKQGNLLDEESAPLSSMPPTLQWSWAQGVSAAFKEK